MNQLTRLRSAFARIAGAAQRGGVLRLVPARDLRAADGGDDVDARLRGGPT